MTIRTALSLFAILLLAPALQAGGKKKEDLNISFHIEAEFSDDPRMVFKQVAYGKERCFLNAPEITKDDIQAFVPFPEDGGEGYGVAFQLSRLATTRFAAITGGNLGRWMVSRINGRVMDGFLIDKQIDDGVVVIWKGVTKQDLVLLDAAMPRINAPAKKPKK